MGTIGSKTKQIILDTYEKLEEVYPIYSKDIKLSELFDEVHHYQELGLNLVDIHIFSLNEDKSESSGLYCTIMICILIEEGIHIPSRDLWGLVNLIFHGGQGLSDVTLTDITKDLFQVTFKINS